MKIINGDWFAGDWEVGIHVANLYHTFGSGIAYFIKNTYPSVYGKDLETKYGDESKLGEYSRCDLSKDKTICNLYAMRGIGNNGHPLTRNLQYDHFYDGFYKICRDMADEGKQIIGVPYLIGCCRAGGNWNIVERIMSEITDLFDLELQVYKLEEFETTAKSTIPDGLESDL